jgi:hypothetical protein
VTLYLLLMCFGTSCQKIPEARAGLSQSGFFSTGNCAKQAQQMNMELIEREAKEAQRMNIAPRPIRMRYVCVKVDASEVR